jgi:hypothetical protein
LNWKANLDADGYKITCTQGGTPVVLDFGPGGNASYIYDKNSNIVGVTFTGLPIGLKYDFTIIGTNSVLGVESAALKCSWNPNMWMYGFYAYRTSGSPGRA